MGHHRELKQKLAITAHSAAAQAEDRLGHIARPRLKKEVEGRSHSQSLVLLLRTTDCLWKMRTNGGGDNRPLADIPTMPVASGVGEPSYLSPAGLVSTAL